MNLIIKLYKKINFEIEYLINMTVLNRMNHVFTYPIIVDLTFNKSDYLNRYYKGISVKNQIFKKVGLMEKSIKRKLNRPKPSQEAINRLRNLYEIKEAKQDVIEYFGKDAFELN